MIDDSSHPITGQPLQIKTHHACRHTKSTMIEVLVIESVSSEREASKVHLIYREDKLRVGLCQLGRLKCEIIIKVASITR